MYQRFIQFSDHNRLFGKGSRLLLAVSGGIDSMVMAELFRATGIARSLAHCNFSLRGRESDEDEAFVKKYSDDNNLPFFCKRFDTLSHAVSKRISVQMAARELRYAWFNELCSREGFDAVAVAHNLNDNIETMLLNLTRGTGLSGLTGMKPRSGNIIRPLLFATRSDISAFALEKKIIFREDSSNSELKYTRNKIRIKILPELEKVNPNILSTLTETMSHLRSSSEIIDKYIGGLHNSIFKPVAGGVEADVSMLRSLQPIEPHIFELFRRYGLTANQTDKIISLLDASPGRCLYTNTHRLVRDRGKIIISEKISVKPPDYVFSSLDDMRLSGLFSELRISDPLDEPLPVSPLTACIDFDKLAFPLTVRPWKAGDRFMPLGMSHMKKLSDFLIDLKIPLSSKEQVLLLLSGNDVVWVMGYRIDNRYRVTAQTKRIMIVTI